MDVVDVAMTAREPFDTLAPEFKVKINGSPLPQEAVADLIKVSVLDDVDAPGMFTITVIAWDTTQMKAKWIDDALFHEGNPVEIALGYRDKTSPLLSGEITGLEPDFPEVEPPTLTVRGYDRRHRLMRSRRSRSFTNCKDSDIVSQLASSANLRPKVEDSKVTLPYVLQHNQTDLEFLATRAHRINYEVVVTDRDLHFRPRKLDDAAELTLHREVELLEFRPRLTTLGQVPQLEVRGWDPAKKKEIVSQASVGDEPKLMAGSNSGPSATQRAFGTPKSTRVTSPVQSQEEADAMAKRGFAEMALGYIRADGVCIGEPRMRAGTVVKIEGIGDRFSGSYYVLSVEHSFRPKKGYRTYFSARRNAT
jgi:Bacteriophage probable baseplate hub protein